jgi:sulfatase modifying factor 1
MIVPADAGQRSDVSARDDNMVWLPGGTFQMGADRQYPEEWPAHPVTVDAFYMGRHTVTSGDSAAFVRATGYITFSEQPLDPALYPAALPELLKPGSAVFRMPDRPYFRCVLRAAPRVVRRRRDLGEGGAPGGRGLRSPGP